MNRSIGARTPIAMSRFVVATVAIAAIVYVAFHLFKPDEIAPVRAALHIDETLGGANTAGHDLALEPRPFSFPADHGPHPGFRNEWWYVTGNLDGADGHRFGYQITLFRTALSPAMIQRESAWATRQAWMAHFAITDVRAGRFHTFERFARGTLGLAGGQASPFHVHAGGWSIESADTAGFFPLRIRAREGDVSIDLVLGEGKPLVLNGDSGLSRKGGAPGNASYYYSFTRLPTSGTISVDGRSHTITGQSWIDREWSTSALADGVSGWDWFAIQLDDTTELTMYRLRRDDGSTDPFSAGTFIAADGSAVTLRATDFSIDPTAEWTSPIDGTTYPGAWSIRVFPADVTIDVHPVIADQEHTGSFRYWEGAVDAIGTRAGRPVRGRGYVELTGYDGGVSSNRIAR
jgi:predicted secreted hydrolase